MFIHTRCIVCVWRRCACAERPRSSPLCLLTSGVEATQQAVLFAYGLGARRTCTATTLTLFRAIVLSRISAKISAVILKIFSSSAQYYCEVLFCGALIRQRLYWRFFTTSKITHSLLCQKVISFLLFFLDIVCNVRLTRTGTWKKIIIYNLYREWGEFIISVDSSIHINASSFNANACIGHSAVFIVHKKDIHTVDWWSRNVCQDEDWKVRTDMVIKCGTARFHRKWDACTRATKRQTCDLRLCTVSVATRYSYNLVVCRRRRVAVSYGRLLAW